LNTTSEYNAKNVLHHAKSVENEQK